MTYGTFFAPQGGEVNELRVTSRGSIKVNYQKLLGYSFLAALLCFCILLPYGNISRKKMMLRLNNAENQSLPAKFPHIIFLLIDDMGYNDIGYSSEDLKMTPTLDSLAENGIKLSSYYSMYVCTPARASLLTGKYVIHNSMQKQVIHETAPWGLPLENYLLPEYLKELGNYKTHLVGKWHLGFYYEQFLPTKRGFDSHFGFYAGEEGYWNHEVFIRGADNYYDWSYNGKPYPDAIGVNSFELMEKRVDEIIRTHDESEPLFLMYSQQAIHYPLEDVPQKYLNQAKISEDAFQSIFDDNRKSAAKLAVALDQTVNSMMNSLKETGLYENSILIVASDNGACSFYGGSNYPLRGDKNSLWEGGVKVPSFIHSPLLPSAIQGTTFTGLFHVSDWMPTIIEGILLLESSKDNQVLDGLNQWPALLNDIDPPRTEVLHNIETAGNGDFRAALQVGDYKLIVGEQDADIYSPSDPRVKSCDAAFEDSSGLTWVFDIHNDPSESNNIYDRVDEEILVMLWDKLDSYYETEVDPAYEMDTFDQTCYEVWAENDNFVLPWHESIYEKSEEEHQAPDTSMHPVDE